MKRIPLLLTIVFLLPVALAQAATPSAVARVESQWSVCVYCGATDQADPKYAAMAKRLGEEIARRGWTLVWGGSKTGLMGAVARGAKESGGRVVGVLPEFIRDWEVAYHPADEMMTVVTMAERKSLLQTRSDAFVVLPGGLGTLDELADTLDLRQLDRHRKPIILFNQDGYYDDLLRFFDRSIAENFSKEKSRDLFVAVKTFEELLAAMERCAAVTPKRL